MGIGLANGCLVDDDRRVGAYSEGSQLRTRGSSLLIGVDRAGEESSRRNGRGGVELHDERSARCPVRMESGS